MRSWPMPGRRRIVTLLACAVLALFASTRFAVGVAADPAITGYPDSMASTGDSITRAFETCPTAFQDCPANSWSTGTNAAVNSQYLRILAAHPAINGHNNNDAQSGARMTALNAQVTNAVSQGVDYITILMGANDVCTSSPATMTSVATFASQFQTAMNTISTGLPDARIFVASIPDIYHLWSIFSANSTATTTWSNFSICQSMLVNPTSMAQSDIDRRALVRQRNIDFNTQLATICAQYIHCRYDDDAAFNLAFTPADVSTIDYFHPSIDGQTLAASASWDATFDFSDSMPPASSATTSYTPGGVSVGITASDNVGVRGIEYHIDAGAWVRYDAPVFVALGSTITWRAVDVNGNSEATHALTSASSVGGVAEEPQLSALPARDYASADGTYGWIAGSLLAVIIAGGAALALRRRLS